jgi:predicted nucleic acid-binding Zn ribbon protein
MWNLRMRLDFPGECEECGGAGVRYHGPDDDCYTECNACKGTGREPATKEGEEKHQP